MSRREKYSKPVQFDLDSLAINFFCIKNENAGSELRSSEIIEFTARLFHLASKRGRVKPIGEEVFNETV